MAEIHTPYASLKKLLSLLNGFVAVSMSQSRPLLKCCGVNNYTDFSGSSFEMTTGHTYPRGCCKSIGTVTCDGRNVSTNVIYQKGCFHKLLKIIKTQSFTLSGGSLGAAAIQVRPSLPRAY
ncbi:PREDICTED: tetraspanin-16 [Mandrillus leucophaeus]|uniref:tetraspanin-16 n=1 Tax=Mandrillus leucophaeus TaxID=9568 RepID=UPI0005F3E1F7|nr:PREDICTED: tetraspanin-16 [Mandrillus leucophaeus]